MDDPEHEYLNDINIDEEFFDDLWELIDYIYYRYPRSFSEDHTIPIGKPKSKYWREQ